MAAKLNKLLSGSIRQSDYTPGTLKRLAKKTANDFNAIQYNYAIRHSAKTHQMLLVVDMMLKSLKLVTHTVVL